MSVDDSKVVISINLQSRREMSPSRSRIRMLIIDDSPDFQQMVHTFLRGTGVSWMAAADTIQAIGMAVREKPHVILLDIGLPGGDGFMLLDRLRMNAHTGGIPIIVTTAQTTPGLEAKAQQKGAIAFLQKPIDKQRLLDTLQHALGMEHPLGLPTV